MTSASLLQDVLRPHALGISDDKLNTKLAAMSLRNSPPARSRTLDDSDDEIVGVLSAPGTPSRSRAPSRPASRPTSPTRAGASKRKAPGPLLLTKRSSTDPLRAFPTEVSQRIFGLLRLSDLAKTSRVCKKWARSQSLNYVWFQHYRRDNFHDDDLPPGKWTRRESKQNWRITFIQSASQRDRDLSNTAYVSPFRSSRPVSPTGSGYMTPREIKEEGWRLEAETQSKPTKLEMREMYKELGGRKSKSKGKFGLTAGLRDKGGWGDGGNEGW